MSKILTPKDSTEVKEKMFYIFIIFSKNKDTDTAFQFNSKKTNQIYSVKEKITQGFRHLVILKHIYTPKDPSEFVEFSFNNNGEIFKVRFNVESANKGNNIKEMNQKTANNSVENRISFIFNPTLTIKKNKLANEKNISQKNVIKITDKIELFAKCLEEKKENENFKALYNDSISFFNSNQDFELLIYLFVKLFQKVSDFKGIFIKFLDVFWEIKKEDITNLLDNQSENIKQLYMEAILNIASNPEKIISDNGFDKAKFYGFILLYLNTYDMTQFQTLSKNLLKQNDKKNFFFDILVHFSSVFSNDIDIPLEEYINYLIGKNCETIEISGFDYFKRIEELIHIINDKKDKIVKITKFKALKIPKHLKYDLESPEQFIKDLNEIIEYSKNVNKLLIFLSGNFWKEMTEVLGKPSADNIVNLFNLRESFKDYSEFVKTHYKNEHAIYKNAEETEGKDELAVCLNRIIQKNIEQSKEMTNDQIINQITKYDIYYKEDNYINRRELDFLDKINYDEKEDIENEWQKFFKDSKFEEIFKNDIENYILKLISKINKFEDLGIVINIINDEVIKELDKIEYLIKLLRKKALNLLKNSDSLKGQNIKHEKLSALINLFIIIYKYNKKLDKIQDIFEKLDNNNKHIILVKLLKSFRDDKQLQDYVFNFYINNISVYYKNMIELFQVLDEENIKIVMAKISDENDEKKNRIISFNNFFMEKESLNLNLLQELSKSIDYIKKTMYYGKNKKILEQIYNNIEKKKLEIKYLKVLLSFPKENVIKRLELLTILNKPIKPEDKYEELYSKYIKAQKEITELKKIAESLKVFHRDYCREQINQIEKCIVNFKDGEIKEFDNISKLNLELEEDYKDMVEKINLVRDSFIFRDLFNNSQGSNQNEKFNNALNNLHSEFIKLKKNTKVVDEKTKLEFQIILKALGLEGDQQTENEIKYMENSSNAEEDIKSII